MTRFTLILTFSGILTIGADSNARNLRADTAVMARDLSLSRLFPMAFDGASSVKYRLPFSLNSLNVSYHSESCQPHIFSPMGDGGTNGQFKAEAYMKYKSSTLHGFALYDNGDISNLRWNETSDYKMVYPYLTADAIGGDMRYEHYNFGGGYADAKNAWEWGAYLSYEAGQYYRNVDPRPKNITGLLSLKGGAGYRIGEKYILSLSAGYERYTQSNSVKFVSETGEAKIYHLTGLGTHYVRFAGNGLSSHFSGNAFSGRLNLIPGFAKGFILSAEGRHYSFEKILDDLNKLPLVSAKDISMRLEIGWRSAADTVAYNETADYHSSLCIKGFMNAAKRTGFENIFGDPASSIYPQAGTEEKFHSNFRSFGAAILWQSSKGVLRSISVEGEAGYIRHHQNYIKPVRFNTLEAIEAKLKVAGNLPLPFGINGRLELNGRYYLPVRNSLYIDSDRINDDEGSTDSFIGVIGLADTRYGEAGGVISFLRSLSRKFSLNIKADVSYRKYHKGNHLPHPSHLLRWGISAAVCF